MYKTPFRKFGHIFEIVYGDQTVQQNSKIGLTKVVYNLALTGIGQQLKLR